MECWMIWEEQKALRSNYLQSVPTLIIKTREKAFALKLIQLMPKWVRLSKR